MTYRIGSGYFGSNAVKTSTANVELIQQHKPSGWNINFKAYKFSLLNKTACTIKVNGGDPIYLEAFQGFNTEAFDKEISTFYIFEANVQYTYIGAF